MTGPAEQQARSHDDEDRYRKHFLGTDAVQAGVVTAVAMLAHAGFVSSDYRLVGPGSVFWLLLAVRGVLMLASALVLVALLRSKSPRTHDVVIMLWLAVFAATYFHVISTRPPEYLGHGVVATFAMSLI